VNIASERSTGTWIKLAGKPSLINASLASFVFQRRMKCVAAGTSGEAPGEPSGEASAHKGAWSLWGPWQGPDDKPLVRLPRSS
jgi:hypothetical protein